MGGDRELVGSGGYEIHLVLRNNYNTVVTLDSDTRHASVLDCLEGVLCEAGEHALIKNRGVWVRN